MAAAARLQRDTPSPTAPLTAGLLRLHADRERMVEREAVLRQRFAAAHPSVATAVVPALAGDVHDLEGSGWSETCSPTRLRSPLIREHAAPTLP